MVQMHLTVPHQQQGPALSCFAALSISLPLVTDPSLRGGVTRGDCSNGQGLFFTIEPCLNKLIGMSEQPAKADKSAPTGFRVLCLKPIIGGGHGVLIRAPLR
jgi:hypothetical protein